MKSLIFFATLVGYVLAQGRYRPVAPQQPGQQIAILRQSQDVNFDGTYQWSYETENGIQAQEQGALKNANSQDPIQEAQGSYQYTAPDGTPISIRYVANENGFQPEGAHLPVAPPIPPAILKSLEYNAAHPEQEESKYRRP